MKGRIATRVLAVLLVLGALTGCSTAAMRAGRLYGVGDYAGAAAAYEKALAGAGGRGHPLWLYRLGVSRAVPGGTAYDPEGAMEAFNRLRRDFPDSKYARRAELPMALLKALARAGRDAAALRTELGAAKALLKTAGRTEEDLARCRERAQELSTRVEKQDKAVEDLRRELEQLKSIDLHRGR